MVHTMPSGSSWCHQVLDFGERNPWRAQRGVKHAELSKGKTMGEKLSSGTSYMRTQILNMCRYGFFSPNYTAYFYPQGH